MFIAHQFPKAPLHGLGFSIGANAMTRYIAQEGIQTRLQSACVLACVSELIVVQNIPCTDTENNSPGIWKKIASGSYKDNLSV